MSKWKYPGQYEYDGLILSGAIPKSEVIRLRDELELYAGDVATASCCRTGTTWVNEIIFMILNRGDEEKFKLPLIEKVLFPDVPIPANSSHVDIAQSRSPPRILKTHMPARYLKRNLDKGEDGPKVVVIARNPKDTLVSFYHFNKTNPRVNYPGDWKEFFEMFQEKRLGYCDFFDYYSEWMDYKDNPNVYFIFYENLAKNPTEEVKKLADFIGIDLSEEELGKVLALTSFDSMRGLFVKGDIRTWGSDKHKEAFIRKGKIGEWKKHFTEEQSKILEERYEKVLKPKGMEFQYD